MTRSHHRTRLGDHPGASAAAALAITAGTLAARFIRNRARVARADTATVATRLTGIGEVESLIVVPLVERLTGAPGQVGEPGVSYLLQAGATKLLFDCGLARGRGPTALERNAARLAVDGSDVSAVIISHLHPDHVGGPRAMLQRSFSVPDALDLPRGVPAFVPVEMTHPRADVSVVTGPKVVAPGVAVMAPLARVMFWLGPVAEQAVVVNVAGFGLVVITGCGHPRIEQTLAACEQALGLPIQAVVGGLHLPVHPFGTPLLPQAVLGSPNWPWRPISERDASVTIEAIDELGPQLVALSSHDSTPWTYDAFRATFGDRYRTLRVGEPVVITGSPAPVTAGPRLVTVR